VSAGVLIIGAGAAGLAAAYELAARGANPLVLEGRPRCGGRIHTLRQPEGAPIELGAEFIHGKPPELERLARQLHLAQRTAPDAHWRITHARFESFHDFWGELAQVFDKIPSNGANKTFCEFLKGVCTVPGPARDLATDFVEGFHAADPARISIQSIAEAEAASEKIEGTKQARFVAGYGELVCAMQAGALARGSRFLFGHSVSRIEWKPQRVVVRARCGDELHSFQARKVLLTLPLGVLQAGAVAFDPPLLQKEKALRILAMGNVVKVNLQLRPGLWPDDRDGFIHLATERFPTWWKHRDVITAWAGGPKADDLALCSPVEIMQAAVASLGQMFGVEPERARHYVASAQFHDWRKDPFARGAYSYMPIGAARAGRALGTPVSKTLFFAGEATARAGLQGTVHGAIESGIRAAQEILNR
jgi:monoamine oxidase